MVRKTLIGFGIAFVLFIAYYALAGGSDNSQPTEPKKERGQAQQWNGQLSHFYGATFVDVDRKLANCCQFTLAEADFSNLQYKFADLRLTFYSPEAKTNAPWDWFYDKADFAASLVDTDTPVPVASVVRADAEDDIRVTVTFKKVPTQAFGTTCNETDIDPFRLTLPSFPGGQIRTFIKAPPPPAGYCLFDQRAELERQQAIQEAKQQRAKEQRKARAKAKRQKQKKNAKNNKPGKHKKAGQKNKKK